MQEVIEHIIGMGYSLTLERFGYQQIKVTLIKVNTPDTEERKSIEQLIPDDHFSTDYLRKVTNYMMDKI